MNADLDTPLDESEIEALDSVLLESGLDAPMDITMLDGFLTAVLSAPTRLPPAVWLPWVWDFDRAEQTPAFRRARDDKAVVSLVMRMAFEIGAVLDEAPESFEPMFPVWRDGDEEFPAPEDWCFGYLRGIDLDPEGWRPLLESHPDWFAELQRFGGEEAAPDLADAAEEGAGAMELPGEEELDAIARIAPAVRAIHDHWRATRGPLTESLAVESAPVRTAAQPGRNDPCPCGSGRKFKLCHGR